MWLYFNEWEFLKGCAETGNKSGDRKLETRNKNKKREMR